MDWEVKLGKVLAPATPGVVNVLNKVAVPELNVLVAEYQTLRFVTSAET